MRGLLLITALLACAVAACGSSSHSSKPPGQPTPIVVGGNQAAQAAASSSNASNAPAVTRAAKPKPVVVSATYVAPTVRLKTAQHGAPAVVLLPDTDNQASAAAEARKLAKLGIGSLVVASPHIVPTQAAAFNEAVAEAIAAVDKLAKRADVDPHRIGFIGEGVGAHVGAVALGRDSGKISAAVLADIGGVVVPSAAYAPARWLSKADGTPVLFQRDLAKRAMTQAEIKKLMIASPPGTLMQQFKSLGAAAQAARDEWIKNELVGG